MYTAVHWFVTVFINHNENQRSPNYLVKSFGPPLSANSFVYFWKSIRAHSKNIIHSLCLPFLWLMPVQTSPPHHLLSHKYHFLVKLVRQHYTERNACTYKKILNPLKSVQIVCLTPSASLTMTVMHFLNESKGSSAIFSKTCRAPSAVTITCRNKQ